MSLSARAAAFVKFWLFSLAIALALLGPGLASADGFRSFDRIVVFGDSLSDSGNAFAVYDAEGKTLSAPTWGMTGQVTVPGIPFPIPEAVLLIPDAETPYATRRFSNGATWIELLAGVIGLGSNAKPAFADSADRRASNYAVAGATAADLTAFGGSAYHLRAQLAEFLDDVHASRRGVPSDALYVIAIGGNDIRAAGANPAVIGLAVQAVVQTIADLRAAGAKKFLVWTAPDVGRTPALRRLDAAVCPPAAPACFSTPLSMASAGYNAALGSALEDLIEAGVDIVVFDAAGLLAEVQTNPGRYGLANADAACIAPFTPLPSRCDRPDRFFFWDGIHPTRAGHAIIALLVGKALVKAAIQDD